MDDTLRFSRLARKTAKRARKINASIALIKRAAVAGILCMPDDDHVLVLQEDDFGEECWISMALLDAAISLTNSGCFREIKKLLYEKEGCHNDKGFDH